MQEEVPEFVEDDEIEESDISDMEVISERTFSNVNLIVIQIQTEWSSFFNRCNSQELFHICYGRVKDIFRYVIEFIFHIHILYFMHKTLQHNYRKKQSTN